MSTLYAADIETGGGLEFSTLYFEQEGNTFNMKEWDENNLFVLFHRMKNNYIEVIKYLNYNHIENENNHINIDNPTPSRDFSYIIGEMEERVEDCEYYIENLVSFVAKEGFQGFVMGELSKLENHNNTIIDIHNNLQD